MVVVNFTCLSHCQKVLVIIKFFGHKATKQDNSLICSHCNVTNVKDDFQIWDAKL